MQRSFHIFIAIIGLCLLTQAGYPEEGPLQVSGSNSPSIACPGGDNPENTTSVAPPPRSRYFDITSTSIVDVGPETARRLLRMAVKKNKSAVVNRYMASQQYKESSQKLDDYVESLAMAEGSEEESLYSNSDEFRDPVMKSLTSEINLAASQMEDLRTSEEEEFKEVPDIAIFSGVFDGYLQRLLREFDHPYVFAANDFSPEIAYDRPVLIIPSGGMYGLNKSETLKASLDKYVTDGGTLIVFAQHNGNAFSVLPVPQEEDGTYKIVGGYGWKEDPSCFSSSVYIDTWHQMLAGQSSGTFTVRMDGYFTNYPSNSTIILRRTTNGKPAMIMYKYGKGSVIVSSMYTDWSYGRNHASAEEIALVRDMIAWAKAPNQLPEATIGDRATFEISMLNLSDADATSAKLYIYAPGRASLLAEQTVSISIPGEETAFTVVSYQTGSGNELGIYQVDYILLDAEGNVIQPQAETDSGRFAVVNSL
jgi:hypothetical protein